jgi:NTE family protein
MKFSTLLIAAGLLCISVHITAQPHSRKKVGIVLSGGGAKGMAHIGALKVIEKAGIPIDYVVGTSMGSIIGGLYSIGYTPEQLDSRLHPEIAGDINQQTGCFFRIKTNPYV